jgi:hypothetical protein
MSATIEAPVKGDKKMIEAMETFHEWLGILGIKPSRPIDPPMIKVPKGWKVLGSLQTRNLRLLFHVISSLNELLDEPIASTYTGPYRRRIRIFQDVESMERLLNSKLFLMFKKPGDNKNKMIFVICEDWQVFAIETNGYSGNRGHQIDMQTYLDRERLINSDQSRNSGRETHMDEYLDHQRLVARSFPP